jgi:hypothetical protein
MSGLENEIVQLLQTHENGLSDEQISMHFGARYADLVSILNNLLALNRLQLFRGPGGSLIYKLIREETAAKFEGLGYVSTR